MAAVRSCRHLPTISFMFKCLNVLLCRHLASHRSPGSCWLSSKTYSLRKSWLFFRHIPGSQHSSRQGWGGLWSKQGSWPSPLKFYNWALTLLPAHLGFKANALLMTAKDSWIPDLTREDNFELFTIPLFWKNPVRSSYLRLIFAIGMFMEDYLDKIDTWLSLLHLLWNSHWRCHSEYAPKTSIW